jgi:hypothetical protein
VGLRLAGDRRRLAGLGLGQVGLAGAGVILASVTLAHALPITPGGVGIIQIGAMLPLTATYGVAPEQALAFAVALALSETGPGIALGAACAIREGVGANWPARRVPSGTPDPEPPRSGEDPLGRSLAAVAPAGERAGA